MTVFMRKFYCNAFHNESSSMLEDLVLKNRSYRRFHQEVAVSPELSVRGVAAGSAGRA